MAPPEGTDELLRRGVLVRIRGLKKSPQLNGQLGRCDRLESSGRWSVIMGDGSQKALKAENLFSFDEYIKVAHAGRVPTDAGPYMNDFLTNPKYDAVNLSGSKTKILTAQERLQASYDKAQREGRKASPRLSQDEERSGNFSAMTVKKVDVQAGSMELAIVAPSAPQEPSAPLPTILAISRGEQRHVAKFFRALRAEEHRWQLLVLMRSSNSPDFFEPAGVTILEQFLQAVLDDHNRDITPFAPMSNVFHMVGMSHGPVLSSAALLSLASKVPDRTGSLNMITGFLPQFCEIEGLRNLKNIHFYVGDHDELGHREYLKGIKESLKVFELLARVQILSLPPLGGQEAGGHAHMHVVKGASHYDISEFIDLEDVWQRLEFAR